MGGNRVEQEEERGGHTLATLVTSISQADMCIQDRLAKGRASLVKRSDA
jgi:hypothetical protein